MNEDHTPPGTDPPRTAARRLYFGETDAESIVRNTAASVPGDHERVTVACALARVQPDHWRHAWQETSPWESGDTDIALMSQDATAAPLSDGSGAETLAEMDVRERTIDGGNLFELGTFVTDSIENWRADGGTDADARLVVCFDAVEQLLAAHSRESVFKFLQLVGARLESAGGQFVAFLDTAAVDEETKLVLSAAFDEAGPASSGQAAAD